ncbi:hypothetical protein [Actinacidiphila paucisporea]|uniref:Uncharacterized protein n=1 Tax=Actinacidiphila paucisporea TaxID=310782 RepID=A0A1M7ME51_9ACTN|nr:hypothetical protein [Actinacidiphila paucisporea]SHM89045.1 hypothetical protein SAMN05216499_1162 [Actinacidiphila paucisporea]
MTGQQPVGGAAVKASPTARSQMRLRAAYSLGLVVTAAALLTAWHSIPQAPLVGIGAMAIRTLTSLARARRRPSQTNP